MHVMTDHPEPREHTMTQSKSKAANADRTALLAEDDDFLRGIVRTVPRKCRSRA